MSVKNVMMQIVMNVIQKKKNVQLVKQVIKKKMLIKNVMLLLLIVKLKLGMNVTPAMING